MSAHRRLAPGIRQTPHGYQVYVRVRRTLYTKRIKGDKTLTELKDAREDLRAKARLNVAPKRKKADARTFADDAADYLALVTSMPSYKDRQYRIGRWVEVFGERTRAEISAREIRAVLEDWRQTGSDTGGPLSPASLNQRRTALLAMYTALDGKSAANPVKDVPPYDERHSEQIRALPMNVCMRLLARIGRRKWTIRRQVHRGKRARESKTRARLRVLLWTGLPHKQLAELQAEHIDWQGERLWVTRRRKGKGKRARWLPLLPPAIAALKRFDSLKCYGAFSNSAMHSALARAVDEENRWRARWEKDSIGPVRPYDLRHSFGTWVAQRITDERALKELLRTDRISVYSDGATDARLAQAAVTLRAALGVATGNSAPALRAPPGPSPANDAARTRR